MTSPIPMFNSSSQGAGMASHMSDQLRAQQAATPNYNPTPGQRPSFAQPQQGGFPGIGGGFPSMGGGPQMFGGGLAGVGQERPAQQMPGSRFDGMSAMPGMLGAYYDPNSAAMAIHGSYKNQSINDIFGPATVARPNSVTPPPTGPSGGVRQQHLQLPPMFSPSPPPGWNPPVNQVQNHSQQWRNAGIQDI